MKKIFRRWNNDSEVHFLKMKIQKIWFTGLIIKYLGKKTTKVLVNKNYPEPDDFEMLPWKQ